MKLSKIELDAGVMVWTRDTARTIFLADVERAAIGLEATITRYASGLCLSMCRMTLIRRTSCRSSGPTSLYNSVRIWPAALESLKTKAKTGGSEPLGSHIKAIPAQPARSHSVSRMTDTVGAGCRARFSHDESGSGHRP